MVLDLSRFGQLFKQVPQIPQKANALCQKMKKREIKIDYCWFVFVFKLMRKELYFICLVRK